MAERPWKFESSRPHHRNPGRPFEGSARFKRSQRNEDFDGAEAASGDCDKIVVGLSHKRHCPPAGDEPAAAAARPRATGHEIESQEWSHVWQAKTGLIGR